MLLLTHHPIAEVVVNHLATNWLDVIVALIIGIFSAGGIAALMRVRKENSKILVDAAQGAVVVQTSVIQNLKKELEDQKEQSDLDIAEMKAEILELRSHLAEVNSLRTKVRKLEQQNEVLTAENTMLKSQVKALSKMVHDQELKNNGG